MVLSRYQLSLTGILNVATTFWSAISYDINAIFSRRTYVPHPLGLCCIDPPSASPVSSRSLQVSSPCGNHGPNIQGGPAGQVHYSVSEG